MIFAIGDANPRAPNGSSVHGGTEGSNPASSSSESGPNRSLLGLETAVERRQRCGFYSEVNIWPSPRCSRVTTSLNIVLGYSAQS